MPPHARQTEDAPPVPPPGFLSMAEADSLISARVNEATQAMLALLAERQATPGNDFATQLAMAIANLNTQGKRNAVTPEEQRKRDQAQEELYLTLNEFNRQGIIPEYKLTRKVVLDEQLIDPLWMHPVTKRSMHTTIEWGGVPNDGMEPINEAAQKAYALFSTWVGGAKKVKERIGITPKGRVVVKGADANNEPSPVGVPTLNAGLRITGRHGDTQEVKSTNILGTVARPAMQINGRAVG